MGPRLRGDDTEIVGTLMAVVRITALILGWVGITALLQSPACAQSVEDFYKGRQINMLIGGGAGGGYDAYYRALARHIGKHIPGQPAIIPRNQPAASGLAAAAALYTTVDKDGATIGAFPNNMPMDPLFGHPGARYDSPQLNRIGSLV